jgi:hypothetical protein
MMRKALWLMLVALIMISVVGVTAAQDTVALTLGEAVEGEISSSEYEFPYTFDGSTGDTALIQMWQAPDSSEYLDSYIILQAPSGDIVAENSNDPANFSGSVIAAKLPEDGTYTIIATRDGGRTGDSAGPFILVANTVETLTAGAKVEATIYGYDNDLRTVPQQYVIEGSGPTKVSFSQEISDLFPDLALHPWATVDEYPAALFDLTTTSGVSSAVVSVELEEGTLYVLTVKDSFSSSVYDDSEKQITITIG